MSRSRKEEVPKSDEGPHVFESLSISNSSRKSPKPPGQGWNHLQILQETDQGDPANLHDAMAAHALGILVLPMFCTKFGVMFGSWPLVHHLLPGAPRTMKNKGFHLPKTWFVGTKNKVFDGFRCSW